METYVLVVTYLEVNVVLILQHVLKRSGHKMKFIIWIKFVLINFLLFTSGVAFQSDIFHLKESKVITIPDTLPIGEVSFIDVYQDKVLLTDNSLGNVYLYDSEVWRKLNPEECHPGFQFRPIEAHFGKSNDIFISNTGIWGFRFENDGKCLGEAHKDFRAPQRFDLNENIVGLSNTIEKSIVTKWTADGKFLDTLFTIPNRFKSAEFRLSIGGIIVSDEFVYAINALDPIIYKFDLETKTLMSKKFSIQNYIEPRKDLPTEARSVEFMKEAQKFLKTHSMNYNLYEINETNILLVVRNFVEEKFYYNSYLFDKLTLKLIGDFVVKNRLVYAGENQVVYVYRETEDDFENEKVHLIFNTLIK